MKHKQLLQKSQGVTESSEHEGLRQFKEKTTLLLSLHPFLHSSIPVSNTTKTTENRLANPHENVMFLSEVHSEKAVEWKPKKGRPGVINSFRLL